MIIITLRDILGLVIIGFMIVIPPLLWFFDRIGKRKRGRK